MMETLEFIWMYLIVVPLLLSLFILPVFFFLRDVKKEMKAGKTLLQVLKSNQKNYKGAPHFNTISTSIAPYDFDSGVTSSQLATNPAYACSYTNINHRHTSPR